MEAVVRKVQQRVRKARGEMTLRRMRPPRLLLKLLLPQGAPEAQVIFV